MILVIGLSFLAGMFFMYALCENELTKAANRVDELTASKQLHKNKVSIEVDYDNNETLWKV